MKLLLFTFILIIFAGCSPQKSKVGKTIWSESNNGLKIGITILDNELSTETTNKVKLLFHNTSKNPIRIYFVLGDYFRSFQSYFYLKTHGKQGIFVTEDSPPHGYMVDEKDFHLIQPSKTIRFEDQIYIPKKDKKYFSNGSTLNWIYENDITKWEGGLTTLDGPTKELFNGKRIPYIWTGRLELDIPVKINN